MVMASCSDDFKFTIPSLCDMRYRQLHERSYPTELLGNNDTLDPVNEFERTVATVLQRLRGLAPAAIENGVGG